jgi:hypothetical protein
VGAVADIHAADGFKDEHSLPAPQRHPSAVTELPDYRGKARQPPSRNFRRATASRGRDRLIGGHELHLWTLRTPVTPVTPITLVTPVTLATPVTRVTHVTRAWQGTWAELLQQTNSMRHRMLLGGGLQFFQTLTGINAIMFFAPQILTR